MTSLMSACPRAEDRFGSTFYRPISRSTSEAERRRMCKMASLAILFAIPAFLLHRGRGRFDTLHSDGERAHAKLMDWISAQALHQGEALKVVAPEPVAEKPSGVFGGNGSYEDETKWQKIAGEVTYPPTQNPPLEPTESMVFPSNSRSEKILPTKSGESAKSSNNLPPERTSASATEEFIPTETIVTMTPESREAPLPTNSHELGEQRFTKPPQIKILNTAIPPIQSNEYVVAATEKTKGRVAVCITGHARTLHHKSVHQSILNNFIQPLQQSSSAVDVFFHVGMRDISRPQYEPHNNSSDDETNAAIQLFNPVTVSQYVGPGAALNRSAVLPCPSGTFFASDVQYSALLRAHECMNLVRDYEKAHGLRYDWVAKTRPDIAFGDPIPSLKLLESDRVFINQHDPRASMDAFPTMREKFPENAEAMLREPFSDHIAIVPRQLADVFFSANLGSNTCLLPAQKGRLINSEAILGLWLIGHGVRYSTIPMFWIIVRPSGPLDRPGGPECSRLLRYVGLTAQKAEEYTRRCTEYRRSGQLEQSSASDQETLAKLASVGGRKVEPLARLRIS